MKKQTSNPTLKNLDVLVGTWTMELSNASFLPDSKTVIRGSVSFEWLEGGGFLLMRQGTKGKVPWSLWLIGRDADVSEYTVLYFDDRGVSRVYQMSFSKSVWKIWRNFSDFFQRYVGKISRDKKTITAYWEKSFDGIKWEHDFDIKYKK